MVYAKRAFAWPQPVLAYLSRCTHRVAISNSRLLAIDERGVTFRWRDCQAKGKARQKARTPSAQEFIRRFLLHVLPGGFPRIRRYGLLANGNRWHNLALARESLHVAPLLPDASADKALAVPAPTLYTRTAATQWWCCKSSCATARFVRRQQHDSALSQPINLAPNMASGGWLRALPDHPSWMPRY